MKYLSLAFMLCGTVLARADLSYDFRASEAYRQLAPADRQRLEQVRRDQVLLWGALDMYADGHNGEVPETLDALVPRNLAELPKDPFATSQAAADSEAPGYTKSKEGWGYRYKRGAPGNRAWVISSVGLPDFPYLAEHGNVGLYMCKGLWISGINPVVGKALKDAAAPKIDTRKPSAQR
jgi:hypothetical protein